MTLLPHGADTPTIYDKTFYQSQQDGSVQSAEIVVPIVLSLFSCHSVVDVGCGVGGWLREFERRGVTDYLGIDGDYVSREMWKIPADHFRPTDLRDVSDLGRRFDLACSLEVAEHLPEDRARSFVAALVKAAPVVLFSAAIPFQDGTGHLNEQWQSYWAKLFGEHGYVTLDCIRPAIHGDRRVSWWYRQNILVFGLPDKCPSGCTAIENSYYLDRIDPVMLNNIATGPYSLRQAGKQLLRIFSRMPKLAVRKVRQNL